jgi:hypothetical protein
MSELGITITRPRGYSSYEVAQEVGITYRQLDHWVRVGSIDIERVRRVGSGCPRRWTEEEVARLRTIVARYNEAMAIVEAFRSGALWASTAPKEVAA